MQRLLEEEQSSQDFGYEFEEKILATVSEYARDIHQCTDEAKKKHNIIRVVDIMTLTKSNRTIQRCCLHVLSNIAMALPNAHVLLFYSGHIRIMETVFHYIDSDWKVCWLGCSTLWNLARPEETRSAFDTRCCDLILRVMVNYGARKHVVNTCLGALSNLSLNQNLKEHIGKQENLYIIITGMIKHKEDVLCASTGLGLLTNLAVDDRIGALLVRITAIELVTKIGFLHVETVHSEFHKNVISMMANLSNSPGFCKSAVRYNSVELLYIFLNRVSDVERMDLIVICLEALGIENMGFTSSLHVAVGRGWREVASSLLESNGVNTQNERISAYEKMWAKDADNLHPIDWAVANGHCDIIQLLTTFGSPPARIGIFNRNHPSVCKAVEKGAREYERNRNKLRLALQKNAKLCDDLLTVITNYLSGIDFHKSVRGKCQVYSTSNLSMSNVAMA